MDTPVEEYIRNLHFGLVEVVYEWARGTPFAEITCTVQATPPNPPLSLSSCSRLFVPTL